MYVSHKLRHILTTADRRLVAVGATVAVTALVGGIAFATSGPDPGTVAERAAPAVADSTVSATGRLDSAPSGPDGRGAGPNPVRESADSNAATPNPVGTSADSVAATPNPVGTSGDSVAATPNRAGPAAAATTTPSDADDASPEPVTVSTPDTTETTVADSATTTTPGSDAPSPSTTTAPKTTVQAPAPSTTIVTPGELEPEPGPGAGQVVNLGGVNQQPSHPGPSMAIVELDLVEGAAPPPPEMPKVPVPPFPTALGGLVGNAFGCQANCIVHATMQPLLLSPDVTFDLATNVDVTASIWISEAQPVIDGGYPVVQGWPDHFVPGWVREWQTTIDFEYETTYWITLRVEDTQGNLKWALTDYSTGAPPTKDQLAANGDGCYFQCIDLGKVEFTDSFDTVVLVIGTDVPDTEDVVFDVAVSTNAPSWSGDTPTMGSQFPFIVDQDGGNDVRGHVSGLSPETTYHVVVKAIDEDGYMAHAVGQFATDPAPPTDVRVTWERFYVHYDGDAGAWGRGEIAWAWGMNDQPGLANWGTPYRTYGARNQDKIGDGTSIVLGQNTHHWVSVEAGATVPTVAVNAHENDTHGNHEHDNCIEYRQVTLGWQHYQDSCMTRSNVALAEGLTVADIAALPKCWQFDVPDVRGEDRCLVIESLPANDQHARFDALLSFHIPA
jgi:hypothetical protein